MAYIRGPLPEFQIDPIAAGAGLRPLCQSRLLGALLKGPDSISPLCTNDFSEAHLPALKREIDRLKLTNLVPLKGLFQDTFPTIDIGVKFGLAHIDADIYSSVKYAQDAVWPRMTAGGYVAYDDADVSSCIGATEAVEDLIIERQAHAEQVWPHFVFRVGL